MMNEWEPHYLKGISWSNSEQTTSVTDIWRRPWENSWFELRSTTNSSPLNTSLPLSIGLFAFVEDR